MGDAENRKQTVREMVALYGILLTFPLTVVAYLIWWLAYLNGGTIQIDVARYGEARFELMLWTPITPIITLGLYYYLRDARWDNSPGGPK